MLPQLIFNAVMLGTIFSLVALGLVLVLSIMNVVNFAHGEFYTMGGFIGYFVFDNYLLKNAGWSPLPAYFAALAVTIILIGLFGFFIEKLVMRSFRGNLLMGMIATIALSILFAMTMAAVLGAGSFDVSSPISGNVDILGAAVSKHRILVMAMGVAMCLFLLIIMKRSKLGMALRACMLNPEVAQLQGINYGFISSISFAIGCALAAVAGFLIVPSSTLNAFVGEGYLMKSFVIIIVGGLGSISGTIYAAFLLGFIESFGSFYFGYHIVTLLSFILIIIILIMRPQGLMGRAE
jgi:branched-chain amino acid transport system permease protein